MPVRLTVAAVAFAGANVLHGLDHERQGTERLTDEVLWGGAALTIAAFATLWIVLRRHPRAPLVAAVIGWTSAVAVAASHVAPHWSAFSDPYPDLPVDALSWAVMLAEILAAAALGVAGTLALRRAQYVRYARQTL
jgi:hypothetical protein